jgi:hypothetical protein
MLIRRPSTNADYAWHADCRPRAEFALTQAVDMEFDAIAADVTPPQQKAIDI